MKHLENPLFKVFIDFLKKKKIYGIYIKEVLKQRKKSFFMKETFDRFFYEAFMHDKYSGQSIIDYSFIWSKTPQGWNFWSELNTEFISVYKKSLQTNMKVNKFISENKSEMF